MLNKNFIIEVLVIIQIFQIMMKKKLILMKMKNLLLEMRRKADLILIIKIIYLLD